MSKATKVKKKVGKDAAFTEKIPISKEQITVFSTRIPRVKLYINVFKCFSLQAQSEESGNFLNGKVLLIFSISI